MENSKIVSVFYLVFLCISLIGYASADGIIIPPRPELKYPSVVYHNVNVSIISQYAETKVDQVFYNENPSVMEGTYVFPLPEGASISNFAMFVDGEKLDGELLDKDKARRIYEDIVRRMKDPALLEYVDRNTFKARVYPIPGYGEKQLQLTYSEVVKCDSGVCRYTYPLNTEKFSSKPLKNVSIFLGIESRQPIKTIYSPSHKINVKRISDYKVEVSFMEKDVKPDKDFQLYYTLSESDVGVSLLTYRERDSDSGFFMLMITPKYEVLEEDVVGKEIVFVLDTSGSMSGDKIVQAKNALKFCLNNLKKEDKFNLVLFSTSISQFKDRLVDASPANVKEALDFVDKIQATGGTNMEDALMTALKSSSWSESRPNMIVFLTDGRPTVGITDTDKIIDDVESANRKTQIRVFVFGVGYDVNTQLLDRLSAENSGVSEYVKPDEDIEVKVSSFYSKISSPLLSNLKLEFNGASVQEYYPKELPDLFRGLQLIVFGRYSGAGFTMAKLEGDVGMNKKTYEYETLFPLENPENPFIPRLWATRKIGFLLDEIRLHGEDQELVNEIVSLSLKYGIMTPYTSFLVDVDTDKTPRQKLLDSTRTLMNEAFKLTVGAEAVKTSQGARSLQESQISEPQSAKVKFVGAKTFYLREDGAWVDSEFQSQKAVDVQYGSERFYQIMEEAPDSSRYLALGSKVRFCTSNGKCFNIGDSGESDRIVVSTLTTVKAETTTTILGKETTSVLTSESTTVAIAVDKAGKTGYALPLIILVAVAVLAFYLLRKKRGGGEVGV